jgi:LDH2 family malate/lactate/ureidoglycolate dehydrogenase
MIINPEVLFEFISRVFEKAGFSNEKAAIAAKVLLRADLRGIDSHGVARLSGYLRLIEAGRIDPSSEISIEHETPSTALVNANKGLGLVVAQEAMKIALEKAKIAGSGWVAVKNSSHFGIAAAHAELAVAEDMIGYALTNASPLVAPAGSVEAMLGTNPVCYAIPAGKYPPVIVDMSTTVASNGKLEIANRIGKQLPSGWVQTRDGAISTNPLELQNNGTLLPLGGDLERSSYKGYALGSMVDIFSGVLSGANFGPWVPPFVSFKDVQKEHVGEGIGHFFGVWRIDAFRPAEDFKNSMDAWIECFKNARTAPGVKQVLIPGEPELIYEADRKKIGIPLIKKVYSNLLQIQDKFDLNILPKVPEEVKIN